MSDLRERLEKTCLRCHDPEQSHEMRDLPGGASRYCWSCLDWCEEVSIKDEILAIIDERDRLKANVSFLDDECERFRASVLDAKREVARLNRELNRCQNELPRDSPYWDEWDGEMGTLRPKREKR